MVRWHACVSHARTHHCLFSHPASKSRRSTQSVTAWIHQLYRPGLCIAMVHPLRDLRNSLDQRARCQDVWKFCLNRRSLDLASLKMHITPLLTTVTLCSPLDGGSGWNYVLQVRGDLWRLQWPADQSQAMGWEGDETAEGTQGPADSRATCESRDLNKSVGPGSTEDYF